MSKNFLNKNQKKTVYRNMGILFALTALCAVLARCGGLGGGETLEDLAARQKHETVEDAQNAETAVPDDALSAETAVPDDALSAEKNPPPAAPSLSGNESATPKEKTQPAQTAAPPENAQEQPREKSSQPQEDQAMEDRITYQEGFYYESLNDAVKSKITGISYPADDSGAAISYDTLRYVSVLYYDFNGESQRGELICHKAIAQDLAEIFYELYRERYPIERICLVDEYQGDDSLSMQDNNTSCFNYRALPSGRLSNHAYGLAVDLNPFYNPFVTARKDGTVNITPTGSEAYADREQDFAYKIDKEDLAYRLFIEHGFTWGGSWRSSKDYQHFEKAI